MKNTSFDTLAVHGGEERDSHFGALSTPIYPASVFAFSDADEGIAYIISKSPVTSTAG